MRHLREMFQYVKPYKWRLFVFIFTSVGYAAFNSLPLFLLREFFDYLFASNAEVSYRWSSFLVIMGLIGASWIMRVYFIFRREIAQQYLSTLVVRDATNQVVSHILKCPLKTFDRWHSGDLVTRISTDASKLALTIQIFAILLREPLVIAGLVVSMLAINWQLALIGFIGIPIMLAPLALINRRIRAASKEVLDTHSNRTDSMIQTLNGIKIVKSFNREEAETLNLIQDNKTIFRSTIRGVRARSLLRGLVELSVGVGFVGVLLFGGWLVIKQQLVKPKDLMTFIIALVAMNNPLSNMGKANNQVQDTLPAAKRLFDLLRIDDNLNVAPDAIAAPKPQKCISFKNVTFNYGREIVLDNVSMDFEVGKFTAIVGPSGSGKSTVLSLVSRFYDQSSGKILLDDKELYSYTPESWLAHIGMVTQDPILFNTSILENIKYGKPDATDEEIHEAASMANIHDAIIALPEGYDTLAGERGAQLSGGQRQRICIARALVRDPSLLILDEATSSLDSTSERSVQDAIAKAQKTRTSIAVAHRLSTIINADKIYVVDAGKIAACGTHAELLTSSPLYQRLYETQNAESDS